MGCDGRAVRRAIEAASADVLRARVFDYRPSLLPGGDPLRRMKWRRPESTFMGKVAFRVDPELVIDGGNHGVHGHGDLTKQDGLQRSVTASTAASASFGARSGRGQPR